MAEADIVQAFRKRLYYTAPTVRVVAIPNAAKRTHWAAKQAKKEGMAPGFPDVMCLAPGGLVAFLEFKTQQGRLSESQREWLDRLSAYGFRSSVVRTADEAVEVLRLAGFPIMERAA